MTDPTNDLPGYLSLAGLDLARVAALTERRNDFREACAGLVRIGYGLVNQRSSVVCEPPDYSGDEGSDDYDSDLAGYQHIKVWPTSEAAAAAGIEASAHAVEFADDPDSSHRVVEVWQRGGDRYSAETREVSK